MQIRPRPKTKLPKLVEIGPDIYPDLLFVTGLVNLIFFLNCEKVVHRPPFFKDVLIIPSRGWKRVAEGDMIKWHTLRIQIYLLLNRSSD